MPDAFILDGVRTPIGRYGGALSGVRPDDLAALVVRSVVERSGVSVDDVDEVVFGAANQAGEDNRNVARMATLLAGLPETIPGFTVNRLCASGMTAITTARQMIAAGDADVVVAGGVESMTRAPWVSEKPARPWAKPGRSFDTSIGWRFANPQFGEDAPPTQDFMYPSISNGCLKDGGNVLATAISVAGPAKIPAPGPGAGQTAYVFTAIGTPGPAAEQKLPLNVTWVNLTTGKSGSAALKPRSDINPEGPTTLSAIVDTGSGSIMSTIFGQVTTTEKQCQFMPTIGSTVVP